MTLDFSKHYWHQRWEIEPGVFTPGHNSVSDLLDAVRLPKDLTGKRILDIGAWNGCFSFECERRGAAEVLGLGPEPAEHTGLAMLRDHLHSKVRYQLGSIYDLDADVLGRFDVVLCFGVFYHLRHPLLGLDNVRRVCRGELYLETSTIDHALIVDGTARPLASVDRDLTRLALLQFYRHSEFNNDPSNWFSPNLTAVREMVQSAGFDVSHAADWGVRGVLSAKVKPGRPEYIQIGSGEGVYYDLFSRKLLGAMPDEVDDAEAVAGTQIDAASKPASAVSTESAASARVQHDRNGVTASDVQLAFRLLLGREAEPAAIAHFTTLADLPSVRRQIMASAEFVRCLVGPDIHVNSYLNFHHIHTMRMTARRQEHLSSLPLDLHDKTVIEIGAGIGLHSTYFLDRNCTVHSTDGRAANVEVMQALFDEYGWYVKRPKLTTGRLDIEAKAFEPPRKFDVVYCYGLLYHCADPATTIRNLRRCSRGLLLLETSVHVGSHDELLVGSEDADNVSQSVHGGGSHPTREWIVDELKKCFPHVGLPRTQPNHEFFPIDWRNPETFASQTMRCVFVASDTPLSTEAFSTEPLLEQTRMS